MESRGLEMIDKFIINKERNWFVIGADKKSATGLYHIIDCIKAVKPKSDTFLHFIDSTEWNAPFLPSSSGAILEGTLVSNPSSGSVVKGTLVSNP